jgi:hypothetical protein
MRVIPDLLIASIMAFSLQYHNSQIATTGLQPVTETGFWVTFSEPGIRHTMVRYYATPTLLVAETKENCQLDITKRSVRRYLDKRLKKEMAKDSTVEFWENRVEKNVEYAGKEKSGRHLTPTF